MGLGCAAALLTATLSAQPIVPEQLPDPRIPGFHFPESEATLTGWITEMTRATPAAAKVYQHGWGLWAALTQDTAQIHEGQRLRVFETWLTPEELAEDSTTRSVAALASSHRRRAPLRSLGQFKQSVEEEDPRLARAEGESAGNRVLGFVKFDPTAADHILKQELLSTAALNTLLLGGAQQIPPFPATALAVKPVFQIIRTKDLVDGRYYGLKAWPGPPEMLQTWSPAQWPDSVWIDVLGGGEGRGAVDPGAQSDGSTRTDESTYSIASFIYYRLSAADAAALNQEKPASDASAGDYAILVAMHVAGREIARWTWQTFWWTPAPDEPRAPSSVTIASLRPAQLRGAARNYSMALAYTMLAPDQPYVGGENTGAAVYAYNPWLEARFGPNDLLDSRPGSNPDGQPAGNNYGVQTNCMSCHIQATYNPRKLITAPRFTGARYVDLGDPHFAGTLQVEFLWSIPRRAK